MKLPVILVVAVVTVTCFVPSRGGINSWGDGTVTYHGVRITAENGRYIAACGWAWPTGTVIAVRDRLVVCVDRGGGLAPTQIDVWMPDLPACVAFGGKFTAQVVAVTP